MTASPSLDGKTSVTNPRAVPARHAASLLVVRNRPSGIEVLMGVRRPGHRFLPNQLVFPGGAVDSNDFDAQTGSEPPEEVLTALQHRTSPGLARAITVAAARELYEETGLSLGDPLRLDRIGYLCRAVTPSHSANRFNARFLTTPAESVDGNHSDSRELYDVRYYPIQVALALEIMNVTRWVVGCLLRRLARPEAPVRVPVFRRL
jgi:8-oxo-dGTP pyrophosphatase MutT (NUDIX family)